ncbi:carbohydrate ABC transporter permease [Bacillus sp. FJAT-26390]|uniref:carbohydrate ABC transporter permease n=1 Tax=Bacillus sp. FJAT-26390 TaxID=1743142 RepID=UPI000807A8CA|nr:carbohydrate ABC transporter permease [Bacillus sp. FJAT-26390]OBZ13163.1 maltose ABC transporter permease [Bacillus sp. FJAT-26390]
MIRLPKYIAALLIVIVHIIPFYLLVNMAFKPSSDLSSKWAPSSTLYFGNFVDAWERAGLDTALINNMIITVCTMLLGILIGSMASYPLSRYKSKLNQVVYMVCVSCLVVPGLTILVPLYRLVVDVGGVNTHWAIILVHVTFILPMTIFLYAGFVSSIPKELDEAALIDGCNHFEIFYRIIFPLLKPITATVVIILGMQVWNDYQFSVFFLQNVHYRTIPVALSSFISQFQSNISWVAAGCLIAMMPMTIIYMFFQKYFIKGMADGAIKG